MKSPGIFLTADWRNLAMLNYAVDPALLERLVPRGTELDAHEGKTYLSLIGFEFNRTRICDIAAPFHQAFEEVNLRFYVRRGTKRGVVFIRELVPKRAVVAVARWAFNENYAYAPMSHHVETEADGNILSAEFAWCAGAGRSSMRVETEGGSFLPAKGSLSEFITEHYWGYAAQADGGCVEYEVQHPQWDVWQARQGHFSGDAARWCGPQFAAVLARVPDAAFLARGSAVTVFKGTRIAD